MSYTLYSQAIVWIITLLVPTTCLSAALDGNTSRDFQKHSPNHILPTDFIVIHPKPKHWESLANDMYENRGIAQIHRAGKEYMLTISCEGIHHVFIHPPQVDLEHYVEKFVQARYIYVDIKKHVQCVKEPCAAITERKIFIHEIKEMLGSEATRAQFENQCGP